MRLVPGPLNLERQARHHDLPERRKDLPQRANPVGYFTPHLCVHISFA